MVLHQYTRLNEALNCESEMARANELSPAEAFEFDSLESAYSYVAKSAFLIFKLTIRGHRSRVYDLPFPRRGSNIASRKLWIVAFTLIAMVGIYLSSRSLISKEYITGFRGSPLLFVPEEHGGPRLSTTKVAAIVENRPLSSLIPIILHFSSVLGPEWPIRIYTSEANMGGFNVSVAFREKIESGQFLVVPLPDSVNLDTHPSVSTFFTGSWFWESLIPFEHVLIFQADSILCSNAPQRAEDFLQYDFIGAPIDNARGLGNGYNGGLSIRSVPLSLNISQTHNWEEEKSGNHSEANIDFEDQWFWLKMKELPPRDDGSPGANFPPTNVALKFAVETIWYDKPLGFHQASRWQEDRLPEVYEWCPEYRMCTAKTFKDLS